MHEHEGTGMTSGTDEGRRIERVETFHVSHTLDPRTGPSIALSSSHAYILVKVTDTDGRSGWGETYAVPGIAPILEAVAPVVIGRSALAVRQIGVDIRWAAEHPYAASALTIAIEDLRARQLGVSVAASFGGPVRDRVRLYAAFGGYVEGVDPADTWPGDVARVVDAGFTAMKFRVGRHPVAYEAVLLEKIRADLPDDVLLMADGNAGYTMPRAIEMGRILDSLGFTWFEEPMRQRELYAGYEHLAAALDIALAGGEIMQSRSEAIELLARRAVDVVQPEPVICGGIAETLWIADLAAVHSIAAMPHTSNNALGIAAGLQVLACLPNPTLSPASDELFLEVGVDDNPHRAGLLTTPLPFSNGWATIPDGPGLGVEIDEEYLRHHSIATTIIDGVGARPA
jgi:D-galactarolactone cycloisomerase